jgi:hypothetical protein
MGQAELGVFIKPQQASASLVPQPVARHSADHETSAAWPWRTGLGDDTYNGWEAAWIDIGGEG